MRPSEASAERNRGHEATAAEPCPQLVIMGTLNSSHLTIGGQGVAGTRALPPSSPISHVTTHLSYYLLAPGGGGSEKSYWASQGQLEQPDPPTKEHTSSGLGRSCGGPGVKSQSPTHC